MSNDNSSKIVKNISTQTVVTIMLALLEIIYFSIMSRLLSRSDFGYFAAATGVMSIFMSLSEAGLGAAIIQKKDDNPEHVSTAFTLSLILGFVASCIAYLLAPVFASAIADDSLTIPLRLLSITVLFHCLNSCGNAVLYRKLRFKKAGLNVIVSQLLSYAVAIIMAIRGMGIYAVIANSICLGAINFIILYGFSVKFPKLKVCKSEVKGIVSFGGWLTLSTLANNIMQQIDKLLLPKWMTVQALGSYNRPAGFLNTVSTKINSIFDTVLFPMLSSIQNDRKKVKSVFSRAVELLNTFSVVLATCVFFNSELMIRVFFGDAWLDLTIIFQILSLNLIFNIDNRLVDCFFRSLNLVKKGFYLRCFGLILTLFAIFLGSKAGLVGVAVGVVFANVSTIVLKMVILSSIVEFPLYQMAKVWICSWKSSIPLIIIGSLMLLMPMDITNEILTAIIFACAIVCELLFFPHFIGKEYSKTIYPKIVSIKNKIKA